ncbi:MAG TPA: 30S ribosomal protein S15 [Candidatus Diapherotrites archaeon]|uniref:30S ribosomal protein S15 n=1 Tax=Candidatus Iainarchaeum sp. TaxID=3101447 RepID=A0A7J4IVM7_9ARCH|nr:30S ribosomal protein S15 [Candidatus Diapherotrites archaeon]
MAKSHAGQKASSAKAAPNWVEYKADEAEKVVVELANSGLTASQIGMSLRDQYGIPSIKDLSGSKVEQILARHKLLSDIPRDLLNLIKRSVVLQRHMEGNRKDQTAKRGYTLAVSRIRRLTDYYIKKGKLAKGWRYTPETAALLVK